MVEQFVWNIIFVIPVDVFTGILELSSMNDGCGISIVPDIIMNNDLREFSQG